jgi:chemosensory pili system protein ChpE/L-lysine exporter family protein LysE/ArgO
MSSFITIFGAAFMLGMIFNAAPGAIFAETIRRSVNGGFRDALEVQFGSLVGDATWAILGLAGVGILLQSEFLKVPVGIGGAGYLAWLAWDSWQASDIRPASTPATVNITNTGSALRSGMILSLSNPQNFAYWAALGSAFGALGISAPTGGDYAVFFTGFMVSSILWCFVCAGAVHRLFSGRGDTWRIWTYRICALAFVYLAIGTAYETISLIG